MDNEKRMTMWCRMWNEDPALAHELMSDDCVQWSDHGDGLDTVIGPDEQERFVAGYRAQHVNVFSPRVFVDAGDRFAYLWDVRKPDGQVLTGIDVNILKDGRVSENWTFVAERRCERPDPGPEAAGRSGPAVIEDLCRRWVQLRNGWAESAVDVVTGDFALFSGAGASGVAASGGGSVGDGHGAAELADLIRRQAGTDDPPVVTVHRQPVVDPVRGHVAFLWTAESRADGSSVSASVGGVDLLAVRDGRFARGWSLTGLRPFRY